MVTNTAPRNTNVIRMLGLLGSPRKMWCISGSFPYRIGFSPSSTGTLGSSSRANRKACSWYPLEEPKEAMTKLASMGWEDRRSGEGISLCVWWPSVSPPVTARVFYACVHLPVLVLLSHYS